MTMQTIEIDGKTLVVIDKKAFDELMEKAGVLPPLPARTPSGNYPALKTCDVLIARKIISRRIKAGWTQKELSKRAGVRLETLSRLESGEHAPNAKTVARLNNTLKAAGA